MILELAVAILVADRVYQGGRAAYLRLTLQGRVMRAIEAEAKQEAKNVADVARVVHRHRDEFKRAHVAWYVNDSGARKPS